MTSVIDAKAMNDAAPVKVPAGVLVVATLMGVIGAAMALVTGVNNPIALGFLGIAVLVVVIGVPAQVALGVSMCIAMVVTFALMPTAADRSLQLGAGAGASVVLLIGYVRASSTHRERPARRTGVIFASSYFVVVLLATVINASTPQPLDLLAVSIAPGMLALLAARRFTRDDMRVFARGFLAFAALQVAVATIDTFITAIPFLGYATVSEVRLANTLLFSAIPRAQGLEGHPIVFSLVLIIAVVFVWRDLPRLSNTVRIALVVWFGWGILLSGTRSAIVALIIGVLFLAIISARTVGARIRNTIIVVVAIAVALTNTTVIEYVVSILNGLSESGSYSHRVGAFESVPRIMGGVPIERLVAGSGVGAEESFFQQGLLQQDGFNIIDNQFVTVLVVGGLLGLLLIVLMLFRSLIFGAPEIRALILILIVMFNTFDILRWGGPSLFFLFVVGLVDNALFRSRRGSELSTQSVEGDGGSRELRST